MYFRVNFEVHSGYGGPFLSIPVRSGAFRSIPVSKCTGLQSKRPQVKTPPCQNVPELVKTSPKIGQNVPMVKNVGQNVPKMIFLILCFMYFSKNLGCLNETVLDKVF